MNIQDFLAQNVEQGETQREVKLERFKSPFVIRAITEEENMALRRSVTIKYRAKGGKKETDVDTDKYVDKLMVACVVVPDLNNAELQASYKTDGDAALTLKRMLKAGEYADLSTAITEFNGFDDSEEELVEEVKN